MEDEVAVIVDGDDLAVVGDGSAIERFLRRHGLWDASKELDLARLRSVAATGSDAMEIASEVAANSSRYVKLTKESARLVEELGLMDSKTPGESHLMIGIPGKVSSWLQAETGPSSLLTNPAMLSGVAGLMSQIAAKQAAAEILDYLAAIDEKVDDVLRKQDNAVVAGMAGIGYALDRAMEIREETGEVDDDVWSTVDQAPAAIGTTMDYALQELEAIATGLESAKMSDLARKADAAEPEVQRWLAVLAHCFRLQEEVDVLQLDRKMSESQEQLSSYRRSMRSFRNDRRERVARYTEHLLSRMDGAVETANGKLVWTRSKSVAVVASGNNVANDVHRFQKLLGIEAHPRSWEVKQLGRAADVGSQTLQKTKDTAPYAAAVATAATLTALVVKNLQDDDDDD